jgi:hypothetical protein
MFKSVACSNIPIDCREMTVLVELLTLLTSHDDIFPHMPPNEVFLAIPDIFAHLEILINDGRVVIIDPGPPALYPTRINRKE